MLHSRYFLGTRSQLTFFFSDFFPDEEISLPPMTDVPPRQAGELQVTNVRPCSQPHLHNPGMPLPPTPEQHGRASARFLREWERRLHGPGAGAKNQPHYNEALRAGASELTMRLLPCDLFPNGYRYASDPWRRAQRRAPLLVHNNWIKGHEAKVARFRKWGMWQGELANRTQLLGST